MSIIFIATSDIFKETIDFRKNMNTCCKVEYRSERIYTFNPGHYNFYKADYIDTHASCYGDYSGVRNNYKEILDLMKEKIQKEINTYNFKYVYNVYKDEKNDISTACFINGKGALIPCENYHIYSIVEDLTCVFEINSDK